ncbi:NAD(P)-binding protein [Biscogniauxia marginata]|nr:NAD(P)-binding protein [Biscogniauxia marginata]
MYSNKTLIYKCYTRHLPVPGKHLAVEPRPFDPDTPPPPGGFTVKNEYLSFDTYQRGQMRLPDDHGTYSLPWREGKPAVVTTLSTVLKSDRPMFKPGDKVSAMADAGRAGRRSAPLSGVQVGPRHRAGNSHRRPRHIWALIIHQLFRVRTKAARWQGHLHLSGQRRRRSNRRPVGQDARMKVIGSTGSDEKVDFVVRELGYDGAWNYKKETTADSLDRLAPEGLDVYYDNVGGEQLETTLLRMKDYGTIVASGMASQYNLPDEEKYGVKTLMHIVFKRLTIHGFVCSDPQHLEKYLPSFSNDMAT